MQNTTYKKYKYNGKELQETGFYDYQARQLMTDAPGFLQMDPLAEKMPWMSPYAYAFNNPIRNGNAPNLVMSIFKNITH